MTLRRLYTLSAALMLAFSVVAKAADLLTASSTIQNSDPTQLGRLTRTGLTPPPSDWSSSKPFPGSINTATSYHYQTFPVTVGNNVFVQVSIDDPTNAVFASAYLDSYNPGNAAENYLGDAAGTGNPGGDPAFFQVVVPAGHNLVVVVTDVLGASTAVGHSYNLLVEGFLDTQFTDRPVAPAAPTLLSPANGATGVASTTTLKWNAVFGANSYDVYFGAASTPPLATNTAGTSYATGALGGMATYYWRVVAKNAVGSANSATYSFTTAGPQINQSGVTNAAAPIAKVARGGLATIYGANFTPGTTAQAGGLPLPLTLGGVSVTVGGVAAPLYYIDSGQINLQVPFEVPAGLVADVIVTGNGAVGAPVSVSIADYSIGVFSYFRTASAYDPVVVHTDNSLVSPAKPAIAGETLVVYVTGIGKLHDPPSTGGATPSSPLPTAIDTPVVTVGGSAAKVLFAGLTPGSIGLAQINITLPPSLATGNLPMVIQFPGDSSPGVNLFIAPPPTPDLTIAKKHTGNFTPGQTGATYTITVGNSGTGPTSGAVTVTDTLPAGLTATSIAGSGWTCTQPSGSCVRSDVLAAGASYPAITLTVNVATNVTSSVTNTATVSGGGETNTGNDTASDPATIISASPPDLTITKKHTGNFTPGQTGATYTITVSNIGSSPTSGAVAVTDTLPAGLTATTIAGTGWTCVQPSGPCVRSDVLAGGASYPAITLTVNVAMTIASSVTNTATVSGGGETNTGNDTASDPTATSQAAGPSGFLITTFAGPTGIMGLVKGSSFDQAGNLYAAIWTANFIVKVSKTGGISTVAGTGTAGFAGDGGLATSAQLNWPMGVAVNSAGEVFIADTYNERIRRIGLDGKITTVVGNGTQGYSGDGGPAQNALIYHPRGLAFDDQGNLLIADGFNFCIRKVTPAGIISTVAKLSTIPEGITVDHSGNIYASGGPVFKITPSGAVIAIASITDPEGVAVDTAGNVFVADTGDNQVRRITPAGVITTIAGTGVAGFGGDNGDASAAQLNQLEGITLGPDGALYVSDSFNYRIRKLTPPAP